MFGTIGVVFNIEITKRGRMLTGDTKDSVESASGEAATTATTRDVISSSNDRHYAQLAIDEAVKSVPEDDRAHPKVGAVVVKDGKILAQAHRGEFPGSHAEYIALEKKLASEFISGATVYTTLEPCTVRNDPKIACAYRLAERNVARVVIGILDPNPTVLGKGWQLLNDAGIETQFFPPDLMKQVRELNRDFIREQRKKTNSIHNPPATQSGADGILAVKWTPNISQLTYINVPRISQIAGLEGIQLTLDHLPEFTFLNDLGFELNTVMVATSRLISKLQLDAAPLDQVKESDDKLVGATLSFSELFRTKNGPRLWKARDKREVLTFSGDLVREPHIYRKLGALKIVMMIDPRWITSSTAFVQFSSGQQHFAGLCIVNRVEKGLIFASPLILGTPKGPWDEMFERG
jgi:pyrimidine deaminase RibD-like protein